MDAVAGAAFGDRPNGPSILRTVRAAKRRGPPNGDGYDFPLTQRELSECLGLTVVHANCTIQELRRRNLIELGNRQLTILDCKGLQGLAEFDASYLYLEQRPV